MLFDYQDSIASSAAEILTKYKIVYLSMQVRTGKSLTALSAADRYGAKAVLFFTKKKAIASIEGDYKTLNPSFDLTVTNYEQAENVIGEFDLVVLDEAHCLGQFPQPAERVKLLKTICVGKPIIYLSGTPSPESFSQFYHQFFVSSFSPFAEWGSFYKWAKEFVTVKKKYFYNREVNDYSKADWSRINDATKHLFISYTQEEAGFKQMVEEETLRVQMKPGTYVLSNILLKKKIHTGKNGEVVLADTAVKLQNKLHQVFSGTVICDHDGSGLVFDASKIDFILDFFAGKKIAIYYVYKSEKIMLQWHIQKHGLEITESPEEFNTSENKIFISQIRSGREGINLSTADAIVMLNIEYSYVSYAQVKARLQLKDRTKPAKVYWVFAAGGIEEKIYQRVIAKQDYTIVHFRKDYAGIGDTKKDHQAAA